MEWLFFTLALLGIGFYLGRKIPSEKYEVHQGEIIVASAIRRQFPESEYYLINNVTLPTQDGTTQVDHVLVSLKGIFVIESKHYSGHVVGSEKSAKWMQITKWEKRQFQNPLRQNYKHVAELNALLPNISKSVFKNVVVFSGTGKFSGEMPSGVMHVSQMYSYFSRHKKELISADDACYAIGKIQLQRKEESKKTDDKHVADLKARFKT